MPNIIKAKVKTSANSDTPTFSLFSPLLSIGKKALFAVGLLGTLAYADSTTNRLNLTLPTVGSPTWGQKVNANFQILDSTVNTICTGPNCGAGGTTGGINSAFQYSVPYYSVAGASNVISGINPGVAGQVYTSSGSLGIPFWSTPTVTSGMTSGATYYIQNTASLQSDATFYVSSGTVSGQFSPTTIRWPDGTIQVSSPTAGGSSLTLPPTAIPYGSATSTAVTDTANLNYTKATQTLYVTTLSATGALIQSQSNSAYQLTIANPNYGGGTYYAGINFSQGPFAPEPSYFMGVEQSKGFNLSVSGQDLLVANGNVGVAISTLTVSSMTVQNITINGTCTGSGCGTGGGGGGLALQPSTATINISSGLVLSGAAGANGSVLTSGGSGAVPTWQVPSSGGVGSNARWDVFAGPSAGAALITGSGYNTLFGYGAGDRVSSGTMNTITGSFAGEYITTGTFNSCYGAAVCGDMIDAVQNSCFGSGSSIGHQTCQAMQHASSNTVMGASAMSDISGTEYAKGNSIFGFNAHPLTGVNNSGCFGINCEVASSDTIVLGQSGTNVIVDSITFRTSGGIRFADGTTQNTASTSGTGPGGAVGNVQINNGAGGFGANSNFTDSSNMLSYNKYGGISISSGPHKVDAFTRSASDHPLAITWNAYSPGVDNAYSAIPINLNLLSAYALPVYGINLDLQSYNGSGSNEMYGLYSKIHNMGSGTHYAGWFSSDGPGTNYGVYVATGSVRIPLASQSCIGTDANGVIQAGTCTGGSGGGVTVPSTFTWSSVNMSTITVTSATIAGLHVTGSETVTGYLTTYGIYNYGPNPLDVSGTFYSGTNAISFNPTYSLNAGFPMGTFGGSSNYGTPVGNQSGYWFTPTLISLYGSNPNSVYGTRFMPTFISTYTVINNYGVSIEPTFTNAGSTGTNVTNRSLYITAGDTMAVNNTNIGIDVNVAKEWSASASTISTNIAARFAGGPVVITGAAENSQLNIYNSSAFTPGQGVWLTSFRASDFSILGGIEERGYPAESFWAHDVGGEGMRYRDGGQGISFNVDVSLTPGASFTPTEHLAICDSGVGVWKHAAYLNKCPTSQLEVWDDGVVNGEPIQSIVSDGGTFNPLLGLTAGWVANKTPSVVFRSMNGNVSSPQQVLSGNTLGMFAWWGYGTSGYSATYSASAGAFAAENFTSTNGGTNFIIGTTPLGTVTRAASFKVDSEGRTATKTLAAATSAPVCYDATTNPGYNTLTTCSSGLAPTLLSSTNTWTAQQTFNNSVTLSSNVVLSNGQGTSGQCLQSQAGSAPQWGSCGTGGGGASTLAVYNGATQISSPTISVSADGVSLTAYAIGSSSAGFKANPSSVTLQGNSVSLAALSSSMTAVGAATGTLATSIYNLQVSTGNIATSTGTLATAIYNLQVSTGNIATSTGTWATATASGPLKASDWVTFNAKQAAGSYLTGNQTITLSGNATGSGTTAITVVAQNISLSTQVVGTLPAGNMVSTAAFINSTQTWSGGNTFNSWTTHAGTTTLTGVLTSTAIYVSSATIGTDEYSNGAYVAISTISWANGNMQKVTLTASTTFNFIAPAHPGTLTLRILTGSGGFTASWPASVKWSGGTAPTITTTASRADFVVCKYASDAAYYCSAAGTQNFTP